MNQKTVVTILFAIFLLVGLAFVYLTKTTGSSTQNKSVSEATYCDIESLDCNH